MTELGRLTSPEVAAAPAVLLLPVGSTEQHGPHLPLDTDVRIAEAVAKAAAARLAGQAHVVVAPALPYGSSGEHAGFAGTLSIGAEAFELVLIELARSAGAEFRHLLVVNGHGGNIEALGRAVARLQSEGRPVSQWSARLVGADAHAGRTETSLMLAVAPALVRMDRAVAGDRRPLGEVWDLLRSGGVAAVSSNGVLGDPIGASAAEGAALLDELIEQLVSQLRSVLEATGGTAAPAREARPSSPFGRELA